MWISCIYHVTDQHEWLDGACLNGTKFEQRADYLEEGSEACIKLQQIIYDPNLLRKMDYYVNCRTTAAMESFQNVRISYAAKRQHYQYEGFTTRNYMAAIDHMHHKDRDVMRRKSDGGEMTFPKYLKAARHFVVGKKAQRAQDISLYASTDRSLP